MMMLMKTKKEANAIKRNSNTRRGVVFLIAPVVTDKCREKYDYLIITANLQVIVLSSSLEEINKNTITIA